MATPYKSRICSTSAHWISSSGKDENNAHTGGMAGDQTGEEWRLREWYPAWTHVLRWPDVNAATLLAQLSIDAALNDAIGYDRSQRHTYWAALKKAGYLPSKIRTKCEQTCASGANANVHALGYLLNIPALKKLPTTAVTSHNILEHYRKAGFRVLTAPKYTADTDFLLPGDILLAGEKHVAVNVTAGRSAKYTYRNVIGNLTKYRTAPATKKLI